MCLKSPASRLFTQPFIQTQIKENIKVSHQWPLCGEFTCDRWISCTNCQKGGKRFHFMTSSCHHKKDTQQLIFRTIYGSKKTYTDISPVNEMLMHYGVKIKHNCYTKHWLREFLFRNFCQGFIFWRVCVLLMGL